MQNRLSNRMTAGSRVKQLRRANALPTELPREVWVDAPESAFQNRARWTFPNESRVATLA